MPQYETIPKGEQEGVLASFWVLLREAESKADCDNDAVLKNFVSQYYEQWNRITGANNKPIWETRDVKS